MSPLNDSLTILKSISLDIIIQNKFLITNIKIW